MQKKRCFRGILLVSASLLILVTLLIFDPAETSFFPACPFHLITGLHCPGCGSLRAVHQLLHGNILNALDLNPLMVLFLPFLGCIAISYLSFLLTGKYLFSLRFTNSAKLCKIILWLFLIYWILRNIPYFPFNLLAP